MPEPRISPRYLILGKLKQEYIISADQQYYHDRVGGSLIYTAGGASLWLEDNANIGLIGELGENVSTELLSELNAKGYNSKGVKVISTNLEHREFKVFSDLRTSVIRDPMSSFAQLKIKFPKGLLGYLPPMSSQEQHSSGFLERLNDKDIPREYALARAAHICELSMDTQIYLSSFLKKKGIGTITVNASKQFCSPEGRQHLPQLLSSITCLHLSEEKLLNLFPGSTERLWEMLEELGVMGAEIVVVKRGEKGQLLYERNSGKKFEIPAYPSGLLDLHGAGDSFCGGFLVGYQTSFDPITAALFGNISASFAVEGHGTQFAEAVLPDLAQARLAYLRDRVREI